MTVTRAKAEAVTRLVAKTFGADAANHPTLLEDFDGTPFVVTWEGGPYQWTYSFPYGGVNEELACQRESLAAEFGGDWSRVGVVSDVSDELPPGVDVEPLTHYSIGVYPA